MPYYTMNDYQNMLFNGIFDTLNSDVEDSIKRLSIDVDKYVKSLSYTQEKNKKKFRSNNNNKNNRTNTYVRNNTIHTTKDTNIINVYSEDKWNTKIVFNGRPMSQSNGIEKPYNELKLAFNKLTHQNYDTIIITIMNLIEGLIDNDSSDNEEIEDTEGTYERIFSIYLTIVGKANNNEVYIKCLKELVNKYPTFVMLVDNFINDYYTSYDEVSTIDPVTEYEEYCKMTQLNEKRKNYSRLIVGLYINKMIKEDDTVELLNWALSKVFHGVNNSVNESLMMELSDNINIIILCLLRDSSFIDDSNDRWREIKEMLRTFSRLKAKDTKSISSRSIFKFMDVVEAMSKL